MMQNITYNPIDQDPFFSFFAFDFHHNYWCLLYCVSLKVHVSVHKEIQN